MIQLNLPKDLQAFLQEGRQLEYDAAHSEPGRVVLKSLAELEIGAIWINSDESPLMNDDPNAGEDGYYEVPAVSLTAACEGYDPDFILLWLPHERLLGTWDCDQWDLRVFPGTTWWNIVQDPTPYLNAQWSDYQCRVSQYFKPYPTYEFRKGMPF
jgi:hypothetical protein